MLNKTKNEFTISILQKLRDRTLNRPKEAALDVPDVMFAEGEDAVPTLADDMQNPLGQDGDEDATDLRSSLLSKQKKLQSASRALRRPE